MRRSILETFYGFYEKGFVYKGLKPVYWCSHDHTALAEAEVEYEMHTSPSVYVRYKLTSEPEKIRSAAARARRSGRSSGRRRRGRCRRAWPWRSGRRWSMSRSRMATDVYIVAEALAEQVRAACTLHGRSEACQGDCDASRARSWTA